MKKNVTIALTALLMFTANSNAQAPDSVGKLPFGQWLTKTPWIVSFGGDIVNDHAKTKIFDKFLNYDYYPAKFTAEKVMKKGWSVQGAVGTTSFRPHTFLMVDGAFKYDFNNLIGETKWFDPFAIVGAGYSRRNPYPKNSIDNAIHFNVGMGFNIWAFKNVGFTTQGLAKFGNDSYLQASFGLVFKIGGSTPKKCEVAPKTKESEDALQHLRGIINK